MGYLKIYLPGEWPGRRGDTCQRAIREVSRIDENGSAVNESRGEYITDRPRYTSDEELDFELKRLELFRISNCRRTIRKDWIDTRGKMSDEERNLFISLAESAGVYDLEGVM